MDTLTAQLPPIEASDDKIFTTTNSLIMLDGASAFVPVPVSPAIYAGELGACLSRQLDQVPDGDLVELLTEAIHDVAFRLDLRPGRSPSSTVTILREHDGQLDVLLLGGNLVVMPGSTITDTRLSRLDLEPSRQYRARLARGYGFDETHRAILRELQTQQADRRNRPGGYWIAEAEPAAARHAVIRSFRTADVSWVGLATDGAYNPMRHLRLDDWPLLASANAGGLQRVLRRCENWEVREDPEGLKCPRAKRQDDKSLAMVRLPGLKSP